MIVVRGGRSAADVWEDYARIARWPTWSPQITSVRASADRIAPGVTGTVHCGPLRVRFTVTDVDEDGLSWRWTVAVGPVRMRLRHGVLALPGGCATTLEAPAPYLPAAWVALRRLVSARRQQPGDRLRR